MSVPYQVTSAVVNASTSGDNTIVAASAGNPIKVWKIMFTNAAAVNVTYKNGASTNLSGAMIYGTAGATVLDGPEGFPLFACTVGNAFIINLSGAVGIAGTVWYSLG